MNQKHHMQGVVAKVAEPKPINTRNGQKCHVRFQLQGQENWYTILFVEPHAANMIVAVGQTATFQYEVKQNGQYTNYEISVKDFQASGIPAEQGYQQPQEVPQPVQQAMPQQQPPQAQPMAPPAQSRPQPRNGAMVGNALNNAATILGAGATVQQLAETAKQILVVAEELAVCDLSNVQVQTPMQAQPQQPVPVPQQPQVQQAVPNAPAAGASAGGYQPVAQQQLPQQGGFDDDIPFN